MIRLTDYQIAEAFGDILLSIYKKKIRELNEELQPYYDHIDKYDCPQYSYNDRCYQKAVALDMVLNSKFNLFAIEHINRIRNLYKKMKKTPEIEKYELNIQKAKNVPIETLYNFTRKKNMLSCPFHSDSHPSVKLNKNNTIKCFSCGFFGDSISLFMKLNNLKFKEAVQQMEKM